MDAVGITAHIQMCVSAFHKITLFFLELIFTTLLMFLIGFEISVLQIY